MKRILVITGILLTLFLIWFAGPYVGLEAIESRIYAIIIFLLIFIVIGIVKIVRASRVASFIANLIKKQADDQLMNARPDQKENIEAVKNQFMEAIEKLKKSKLGKGHRGSTALYELPWYIIIGPPATGKSTLLRHSGLNFPLTDYKIQGVGGTRNCDWWFANDGIILDTAGRYTVESEDKEEWAVFLDILKKARKKQPINGVIVAISISDLISGSDDDIEEYAKKIKAMCDELLDKLEIKFPIYLMFTKCDLMDGFVDFFGDLTKSEREQVWGCTLTDEQRNSTDLAELFGQEMDKLTKTLYNWRLDRLSNERKIEKRERVFLFPLQYSNAQSKIIRFVTCLFKPNPYRENPVLRGFYFTCGTQEGSPIDKIIGRSNPAYSDEEKKSYFIKDCFTEIIFPDKNFAQFTDVARQSRRRAYLGSIVLSSVLAVGLVSGITVSYFKNKNLAAQLHADAKKVTEIKWDLGYRMDFQNNFTALDHLRARLATLETYKEDSPPLGLRFGLYGGNDFIGTLRDIYLFKLNEIMVVPLKSQIEKSLRMHMNSPRIEWDSLYNTLKAYLMLSMPDKVDEAFLNERLSRLWESYLVEKYGRPTGYDMGKTAREQTSYYLSHISKNNVDEKYILKPDPAMTRKIRSLLNKEPAVNSIYLRIKKEAEDQFEPFGVKDVLPPENRGLLVSTYEVPGIFTKYAYEIFMKDAIKKGSATTTSGDWVLGDMGDQDNLTQKMSGKLIGQLNQLYVNDYMESWGKFIGSISVAPFQSVDDLVRGLSVFSSEHSSPLVVLLNKMTENMEIKIDTFSKSKTKEAGQEIFDKLKRKIKTKIGLTKTKFDTKKEFREVPIEKEHLYLSRFLGRSAGAEDKKSGMGDYLETLRTLHEKLYTYALGDDSGSGIKKFTEKLYAQDALSEGSNEIINGLKRTNYIFDDLRSRSKDSIKRLFLQVFERSAAVCVKVTSRRLNRLWEEKVYKAYKRDIAGRYPFSQGVGDDVPRSEVSNFFMPESGIIWQFYEKELKFYLTQDDDELAAKKWRGINIPFTDEFLKFFQRAILIKDALFWKDKRIPKVKFWIRPHPPKSVGATTVHVSKIKIHLNGQELIYKMGPEMWEPFSWPGEKLEQEGLTPTASLEIIRGVAGYKTKKSYEGEWSFFRLLDKAKIKTDNNKFFKLTWDFQLEGERVKIEADLKTESPKNPFIPGMFTAFSCPDQVASF